MMTVIFYGPMMSNVVVAGTTTLHNKMKPKYTDRCLQQKLQ